MLVVSGAEVYQEGRRHQGKACRRGKERNGVQRVDEVVRSLAGFSSDCGWEGPEKQNLDSQGEGTCETLKKKEKGQSGEFRKLQRRGGKTPWGGPGRGVEKNPNTHDYVEGSGSKRRKRSKNGKGDVF